MSKAPAQKKKKTVIPAHVKPQTDNADSASRSSGDDNDNDNDDDNLSINDKCVGLSCIIRLSTDSYTPETYEKSPYP